MQQKNHPRWLRDDRFGSGVLANRSAARDFAMQTLIWPQPADSDRKGDDGVSDSYLGVVVIPARGQSPVGCLLVTVEQSLEAWGGSRIVHGFSIP